MVSRTQSAKDKTAAEQDATSAEQETAKPADGNVEAPTQETTKQEAEKSADVPAAPVEAEDQPVEDEAVAETTFVDDFEGALGTTSEVDKDGVEYDAPYTYLTAQDLARTADWDDPARSWVSQENTEREDPVALTEVHGAPGQTFRVRELPDRKVAEAAGIDYAQFVAGLPVRPDVPNEAPRKGIPA